MKHLCGEELVPKVCGDDVFYQQLAAMNLLPKSTTTPAHLNTRHYHYTTVKTRWSARLAGKPIPDYTDGGKYDVIDALDRQLDQSHARAKVGMQCVRTRNVTLK